MTCIVGVIQNKKVYIGGDSAGVSGLDVTVRRDVKVFKVGKFVIGCTSSFRMIQLLRFSLKPPKRKRGQDVYEYMCTDFINAIRKCFKDGGFVQISNSVESGGSFLVGHKGRLFTIHDDFQVGEPIDGYDSVGCGEDYAKGALMNVCGGASAVDKINIALTTATHFSAGVRPPFVIESV